MNKYLTIDNNTLLREAMSSIIYGIDDKTIIYEVESLKAAKQLNDVCRSIDVVIAHPEQSHTAGVDYLRTLHELLPMAKLLLMTTNNNYTNIKPYLESGTYAVISVSSSRNEFITAVRSLMAG